MKRYGLIGYPLTHSFSRKYFTEKFEKAGLQHQYSYDNFSLESMELFPGLWKAHPDLLGLNVTIPYKEKVIPFIEPREVVSQLQACNCIKRTPEGRLEGYNTDVIGFERSLAPFLQPRHHRALILGTGGAAKAVAYVLQQKGIEFHFVSRRPSGPGSLPYSALDRELLASHLLLINTSPLGMFPDTGSAPPIPYEFLGPQHHLFDLVYNPERTLFLSRGAERGASIQNGWEMLLIQAEESWRIWTNL